jgi:transcriptional regulator with XRE-family HTH domain
MEEQGKTQDDVARACNLSQPAVSKWLKGTVPGGEQLARLADLFGVSADWLLGRDEKRNVTYAPDEERVAGMDPPEVQTATDQLRELHSTDPAGFKTAANVIKEFNSRVTSAGRSLAKTAVAKVKRASQGRSPKP